MVSDVDRAIMLLKSGGDTISLDFFDLDQKGGNLFLRGLGENSGAQSKGTPGDQRTGGDGSTSIAGTDFKLGQPFTLKTPSGDEREYIIVRYRRPNVSRGRRRRRGVSDNLERRIVNAYLRGRR
jgi:hypothetical protein